MIVFWLLVALAAGGVGYLLAAPLLRAGARRSAAVVGLAPPAFAVVVYLAVGAPNLATWAADALVDEERLRIEAVIDQREAATRAAPDDPAAWRALAAAQLALPDYAGAAQSFDRLAALEPEEPSHRSAFGEALVMARGGVVSEEARAAFEAAHAADPEDVRAAYYLAEAKFQAGRPDEAIADWGALAEQASPGAPYLTTVARRLMRAAQMQERSLDSLGLAPETVAALEAALNGPARRGPSEADVAAMQDMDPEAQAAMIEGMVGRLAARLQENPDDLEGWRMLARSYQQLQRFEDWLGALEQVRRLAPEDLEAQRDHAYALWLVRGDADAEAVAALEALLERDPKDPVAILGVAEAAHAGGDTPRARDLLTRLVEDPAAPAILREEAERQLRTLDGAAE